jgi:hypothetical protein
MAEDAIVYLYCLHLDEEERELCIGITNNVNDSCSVRIAKLPPEEEQEQ